MKIPNNATLQSIIEIINFQNLEIDIESKDVEFQRWLYDHKDWVVCDEV